MSNRIENVNSLIQKEVADIISNDLNDPRLQNEIVSILKVETSPDLKYAKIFVSIFGERDKKEVLSAIENANGFIRKSLTPRLQMRFVPTLVFKLDEGMDYSEKIDKILKDINSKN